VHLRRECKSADWILHDVAKRSVNGQLVCLYIRFGHTHNRKKQNKRTRHEQRRSNRIPLQREEKAGEALADAVSTVTRIL
jgi:hypothetical protein